MLYESVSRGIAWTTAALGFGSSAVSALASATPMPGGTASQYSLSGAIVGLLALIVQGWFSDRRHARDQKALIEDLMRDKNTANTEVTMLREENTNLETRIDKLSAQIVSIVEQLAVKAGEVNKNVE